MKKRLGFLVLLLFVPILLSASDRSEVWTRMYNRAFTIEQQYSIMQKIVAMDDPDMSDLLDFALAEQISTLENQMNRTEKDNKNQLMRLIVNELSTLRAEDSAGTIFSLYNVSDDHLLKADCLIALGQIRAIDFVPRIVVILRNLNFNSSNDKEKAEILAYAAIVSLERMHDVRGFEPVFFASQGWYTRRIREKAAAVLEVISEDPSEPIMGIIGGNNDYVSKLIALNVESRSSATDENKNKVAIMALDEGLRYSPNNKREGDQLAKLRQAALIILIQGKYDQNDVIPNLVLAYSRTQDINEKLYIIQALGSNGSDEAVKWLSEQLTEYNNRQLSGLSANQTELIYIKQLISSLGLSGNVNAKPVLLEVEFSDYTPAIRRLSQTARKRLE